MLIIGHRGACGYRPEHTLASYGLAVELGADYIEPDLVVTKDGVLVARHENEISQTTDVADHPEFAHLQTVKLVAGRPVSGWFTEDFTLAQLKTLRCRERIPMIRPGSALFNDRYQIPTLAEVIDLAVRCGQSHGRRVGVYPELKHPSQLATAGFPVDELLVATLRAHHLDQPEAPVFVQCFETTVLRRLAEHLSVPLVQLLARCGAPYDLQLRGDSRTYADLATPEGLREVAAYASAIGVEKELIIPRTHTGELHRPTGIVDSAHAAGLLIHAYTFRSENTFLPHNLRRGADPTEFGNDGGEYDAFTRAGVDGIFTDHPEAARLATSADTWLAMPSRENRVLHNSTVSAARGSRR
jgi:glycerophosphoryl diester phosphodiesterase